MADNFSGRGETIGESDSRRNQEQRLRDDQGGSELTDRPEARPVGVPGETASAEAEGPPPSTIAVPTLEPPARPSSDDVGAPVRAAGPPETTLPEQSPLIGSGQGDAGSEGAGRLDQAAARREIARRHAADVAPGHMLLPDERGE